METLRSAERHYRRQKAIARRTLAAARRARWGSLAGLFAIVADGQREAAIEASNAVPAMLIEQGIAADPVGLLRPGALAGVANDGRDLASLLELTRSPAATQAQFDRIVLSQVRDAGRAGASVATASRPRVGGYVRMLVPPSCSRCAVLAGRTYRWNQGFRRHPGCDCRHIPTRESVAGDLTLDVGAYFESLPAAEQERIFTKDGAQAIRDGADVAQVVNARRGMEPAQIVNRQVLATSEGITRRGLAYASTRGATPVRLMPETIYQIADSRADALRLLRLYGYLGR